MPGENLRDWRKEEVVVEEKPPLYRSKYNPKSKPTYSTFTKSLPTELPKEQLPAKKPTVPRRAERPVYGLKTNKNYPTANAVEAILAVPKAKAAPEHRYVAKQGYGKVPQYLTQVKADIDMEKEILAEFMAEAMPEYEGPPEEPMPEADRLELIKKLKRKWAHENQKYQMSIGTDSRSKICQKEYYERSLAQLENDIKLLSRGPVNVRDESEYYY